MQPDTNAVRSVVTRQRIVLLSDTFIAAFILLPVSDQRLLLHGLSNIGWRKSRQ
jgi:hypothetical protein